MHFLGEPVNLPAGITEDDGLSDGEGLVQVAQGVQLPLLALHAHVELSDTLEGQFFFLDQDTDGLPHEPGGDLQHIWGHGGGQEDDLELEDNLF